MHLLMTTTALTPARRATLHRRIRLIVAFTIAPTASITPSRISTVPPSISSPTTGTTRPPVIATTTDGGCCERVMAPP